ncbi:MAG: RNA polymerase sigma factor [Pirellulaceae bacterium]
MDPANEGTEQQAQQHIVQLIRQGEQSGFALLLQNYGGRIAGYLGQRFPSLDDHDIQDVMADAMLALVDSFDSRRGSLAAWFLLLARQRAAGRLRSGRSRPRMEPLTAQDEPPDVRATPLENMATQERWLDVEEVIRSLSTLEQAVVEADLDEGGAAAAEDLANRLHTTPGSVYAARQRARRKLLMRCPWINEVLGERGLTNGSAE